MKLKDIAKLCKARGIITLTPVGGTQWIGDLGAAFPALGMPFMDGETVGVCLDFDEKTREQVKVCNITFTDYELDEYVEGDKELTSVLLRFLYYGRTVDAWSTADGDVVFLDAAYTKPLLADDNRTQLFVRHKIGRNFGYVIGKSGMFVTAIIEPMRFQNDDSGHGLFLSRALAQVLNEVDEQVNAEPITDPETGEIV